MYNSNHAGSSSQVVPCPEMSNDKDASMVKHGCEVKNGDDHHTASSSPSPSRFIDFEIKECKKEPDSGWTSDNLLEFNISSTDPQRTLVPPIPQYEPVLTARHLPVLVKYTVKNPVVLLERCDKIWETLQLIRGQYRDPIESEDKEEEKQGEEEKQEEDGQKLAFWNRTLPVKSHQRRIIYDSKKPFHFSVQKTRKLYPCVTCSKQYLEKRSLRRHALRVHGIIIPVKFRRKPRTIQREDTQNSNSLSNGKNDNFDKIHDSKYSHGKTTVKKSESIKIPSILTYLKKSQNVSVSDNNQSKNEPLVSPKAQYNKCALCRQEVKCVKKHLINYHKIGCSASILKQLEMSMTIEDRSSSGSSKPTLKDILSGKPPGASINRETQNKSHTASNQGKVREFQVVTQKRKSAPSHPTKKYGLNNGRIITISKMSLNRYECDICLGVYANEKTYAKHRRIHRIRGETKENFHKFAKLCKYFNSPLSKRYQRAMSSLQLTDTNVEDGNDGSNENLRSSNSKMSSRQSQRTGRAATHDTSKEDTTCLCGRSFRNQRVLRIHRDNCKVCKRDDKIAQHSARDEYSSDRDSGIGINITIKKRNNSYEIVGKDDDEDNQPCDDTLSSDVFHGIVKSAANANIRQKRSDAASKYSKNHSVLKLRDADGDLIVNIEEDPRLSSKPKRRQTVDQRNDESCSRTQLNKDAADAKEENVRTLRQMCEEVLKKLTVLQEVETEPVSMQPEKKKGSRSVSASHETTEDGYMKSDVFAANFDLTTCAYCNKHFGTVNLYNKHQCTVEEGKRPDEYSLNLPCFSCNATLNSCSQFDTHMRIKHHRSYQDRSYYCYLCPERFWNKKARQRHITTTHDTSCRFCHMDMPLCIINLHESYHLGCGYPCHKCKKAYTSKKNLTYHNTSIHKSGIDETTFCNLCLKSIKVKNFRSHMQSHDGKKCRFCEKEFYDKATTEYHTLIHHGGAFSKIKCNDCGMRYLTKRQLELHKNTAACDRLKRRREENIL